jgi:uncharacterized protein (TIGR02453 family)
MPFSGWPPEALEFYAGLEADNSRSYWHAHRDVYDTCVKAPFLALADAVEREFGRLHIFRPNRDTRFSKDKSPYKTSAAGVTEGPGGAGYYVAIGTEGLFVGSGYYMLANDQLERWRAAVADSRRGPAIVKVVDELKRKRYNVGPHDALKTAPRGYPKDHPRVELLRWKGCTMGKEFAPARWLHTKGALDRVRDVWRDAAVMNRWLDKNVGPSTLVPDR